MTIDNVQNCDRPVKLLLVRHEILALVYSASFSIKLFLADSCGITYVLSGKYEEMQSI
jgi:hypothetical protein